jgi:hypothetical protein
VEAQYGIEVCVQADTSMERLDDCKMETLRSDGVKVIVQPTPMPKFKLDPIVLPEQPKEEQNNQNHHKRHRHRGGHNNKGEEKFKVVESANLNEQNQVKKESAKIEKSDKKQPEPETKQPEAPKKGGWWNRLMG